MRKVVFIFGPPGAGKGTQAALTARELSLIRFDTGDYLNELIKSGSKLSREIKEDIRSGGLVKPTFVLQVVKKQLRKIAEAGFGVVLSGSPRSVLEAFGDKRREGLIPFLVRTYGRKNLIFFRLEIPPQESIKRNSKRVICSICGKSHILEARLSNCPFCGGKLIRRVDDKPAVIKTRLKEYDTGTTPVFNELKRRGFKVYKINGTPKPSTVFKSIIKHVPH